MKKCILVTCVLILIVSLLCGCSALKKFHECRSCGFRKVPIHRIVNGEEDFYLCSGCCVYSFGYTWGYYQIQGSCYYCKTEALCELITLKENDDKYEAFKLVCDTCDAYFEEHGAWPES